MFHIFHQELDLFIRLNGLHTPPPPDECNNRLYEINRARMLFSPLIILYCHFDSCVSVVICRIRVTLPFLRPATKSKSDHPATCEDSCTTDTTATMDENRLAMERVTVYEVNDVAVDLRC